MFYDTPDVVDLERRENGFAVRVVFMAGQCDPSEGATIGIFDSDDEGIGRIDVKPGLDFSTRLFDAYWHPVLHCSALADMLSTPTRREAEAASWRQGCF